MLDSIVAKKILRRQSLEYSMHCMTCAKERKEGKSRLFKPVLRRHFPRAMSRVQPVNTLFQTRAKANDVSANVISANQHFAKKFSMQKFKFLRRDCKLSLIFCPAARAPRRAC